MKKSKEARINIRCSSGLKTGIDTAAMITGKSVGKITRLLWSRFCADQGVMISDDRREESK